MEDHHVDRPGVEAWQHVKLTGTNRSIGLIRSRSGMPVKARRIQNKAFGKTDQKLAWTTWWLWRGRYTRSHPELGREIPQRQWYCVLRHGRVGRCQVFQASTEKPSRSRPPTPRPNAGTTINAGWSSPVARQAHNLKVAGSNPAPATKILKQNQ